MFINQLAHRKTYASIKQASSALKDQSKINKNSTATTNNITQHSVSNTNLQQFNQTKQLSKISQHGANMHYCIKKDGDVEEDSHNQEAQIRRQSTNEIFIEELQANETIMTQDYN